MRERRESVLQSLKNRDSGGLTTYGAKASAAPLGGIETVCTVTGYCRTLVFEFPGSCLIPDGPVRPQVISERAGFKATVVSNLPAYFQQGHSRFPHYGIDVSLRDGVDRVYRKEAEQWNGSRTPMFLLIEQYEDVAATTFANGECFVIDERVNGEEMVEGGREGEKALLAFRTSNGAWPDFELDPQGVNTVLAAVKVEQNVTYHIQERYRCSCFVSDDGRAVYTIHPAMSIGYGGLRVDSPVDTDGLERKVERIRSIHDGMKRDSANMPQVAELIDSVLLDQTQDEGHFRLWYVRLWQAVVDAKRYLGEPGLEDGRSIIAGKLTPKELKDYRNSIAHWWTGKVDFSFVTGIQQTVIELLRRKYRTKNRR